jgi:hypothetical protein
MYRGKLGASDISMVKRQAGVKLALVGGAGSRGGRSILHIVRQGRCPLGQLAIPGGQVAELRYTVV